SRRPPNWGSAKSRCKSIGETSCRRWRLRPWPISCASPSGWECQSPIRAEPEVRVANNKRNIVAIVDDDPRLLESLEDLLESAGYEARTFSSAGTFLASGLL